MTKRVVITGIGVVSSIGIGKDEFWKALIAGKSGISEVEAFDTSEFSTHRGGEIKNFRPEQFIPKERIPKLGRASQLALVAAYLAIKDANIDIDKYNTGVSMGTTMGETQVLEKLNEAWVKQGADALNPEDIAKLPTDLLSANISQEFGLSSSVFIIPNACAAGNFAIGYAYDLIRMGRVKVMLAGGADAFSKIAFTGFNRLLAVAPDKCQPFDKNRKGMLVGEGAGVVILEDLDEALKRKAHIYAEVLGYGLSCDAHHMTAPSGEGISEAIDKALKASAVKPEEVGYLNAHGTGTPANDKEECLAIKKIFGEYSKRLPVSSIKSMLGHTMGAASAIEAIACALTVKHDIIPPTINFEIPDPDCDIDCVPNKSINTKVNISLNSASAFGGNNACLVLRKI
jgi:3-oxoacyl-[acyl-carrier-protein] synthase II